MAHIGVLKVLEQLKIPIDCIAGTSMGAIVGGLYASGMTPERIEARMNSVDWQEAFRDAPPRKDLAFRRKQDDLNFLVRLPFGLKHYEVLLPRGLIQGEKLQEMLRSQTLAYSDTPSFDDLPTPFRAVATDLETGQAVVMDKGDLALAMRASASIPGLFAPVEDQGQAARRRRADREFADGGRACDARGRAHRRRRDISAAAAPAAEHGAVDLESNARDPRAQGRGSAEGDA